MENELFHGTLKSGRNWHVVLCRKPDVSLIEGRHLILECDGQTSPDDLTPEELSEFRLLAFIIAEKNATTPGRWRVDSNGPTMSSRSHLHAHIKLPDGKDELSRLVG